MFHSPSGKFGSAPDISDHNISPEENTVTFRSTKRRRCDCGSNYESKLDIFINSLSEWKTTTDDKLSSIQTSMQDILCKNTEIIASNLEIEKSICLLTTKYDDLYSRLETFQNKTKECLERVHKIELASEELERSSRAACLELRNIPHPPTSTQEDLLAIAVKTCKELSIDLLSSEIFDIHHIKSKSDHCKTILISLNSVLTKNKVLRAYRDYNKTNSGKRLCSTIFGNSDPAQPIYIAEHLTATARRLHYLARELVRSQQYKHCWTSGGRVLLRKDDHSKYIVVNSESQLANLSN